MHHVQAFHSVVTKYRQNDIESKVPPEFCAYSLSPCSPPSPAGTARSRFSQCRETTPQAPAKLRSGRWPRVRQGGRSYRGAGDVGGLRNTSGTPPPPWGAARRANLLRAEEVQDLSNSAGAQLGHCRLVMTDVSVKPSMALARSLPVTALKRHWLGRRCESTSLSLRHQPRCRTSLPKHPSRFALKSVKGSAVAAPCASSERSYTRIGRHCMSNRCSRMSNSQSRTSVGRSRLSNGQSRTSVG